MNVLARLLSAVREPIATHDWVVTIGGFCIVITALVILFLIFTGFSKLVNHDFKKAKKTLDKYELHQFSLLNDALARFFETDKADTLDREMVRKNLKAYHDYLLKNNREAYAHFVSLIDGTGYKKMLLLINKEMPDTYKQIVEFIQTL